MKAELDKASVKRLAGIALLACLVVTPVYAAIGALDNVPAATLLLPYFEVDVAGDQVGTVMFTVHNVSPNPHVAHVTLWTDAGIPTYAFDMYLAGNDVIDVDLRAVFAGIVPHTSRTLSNVGADSGPNISFTGCDAMLPAARLTEQQVLSLRQAHQGLASGLFSGNCAACSLGDGMARGYVTVDVVNRCSSNFPGDPGYFVSGGTGIASNENVLWGEYRIVESTQNQASGDLLVPIEATNLITSGYTFYGRRVNGNASDNRERLPGAWDARYIAGGPFQQVNLQIWRDAGATTAWPCGGAIPAITHRQIWAFDEQENASCLSDGVTQVVTAAASKIRVGSEGGLTPPSSFGFVMLDLRLGAGAVDPLFHGVNQSHVSTMHSAEGRFGGLTTAWPINVSDIPYVEPPVPRLDFNGAMCIEGSVELVTPPSGTPILRVHAPAGALRLSYNLGLTDNNSREVTGQIIGEPGNQWAGPPPATTKTVIIQPFAGLNTRWVWGYHEVVAPFADFEILFYVPGASPALSLRFVVNYAGAL